MASIIKVDQIQSDSGTVNVTSNLVVSKAISTGSSANLTIGGSNNIGPLYAQRSTNFVVKAQSTNGATMSLQNSGGTKEFRIWIDSSDNCGMGTDSGFYMGGQDPTAYTHYGIYGVNLGSSSAHGNGTGIKFPATQNASTDANTLDDYEEGSFSPILKMGSTTQTQTSGGPNAIYTKIGKLVFFSIETYFTKSGTGDFSISSLPFTTAANRQCNVSWYFQFYTSSMPSSDHLTYIESSGTGFTPQYMPSGGTQTVAINDTHFTGSTNYFYASGTYMAAS